MRHVFLVNPAAGPCDRTAQIKRQASDVLGRRGLPFTLCVSRGPGDLTHYAREAAETGEDVVLYACGGDGTLHEVVNGAAGFDNAVITHLPCGSGNDFVKLFDQPDAFRDLERLLNGREVHLDLIRVKADGQTRYAVNICSLGLDARIGTQAGRYRRLPVVGGKGAYLLSAAAGVLQGTHQHYTVDFGARRVDANQTLVCICNGCWYGGSFHPVPDARPDDGQLDILLVKPVNLLRLATAIGQYKKGNYRRYPELIDHCRTGRLSVTCAQSQVLNLDGEALTVRRVSFAVVPRALRFLCPQGVRLLSNERKEEISGVI